MNKEIKDLPPFVGSVVSTGDIPIEIAGVTYRFSPGQLSGTQNNIPLKIEILSSVLDSNDIAGFVSYFNGLSPNLGISTTNSIVQFLLTDTRDVYQLTGVGKGIYGLGQLQITSANVLKFAAGGSGTTPTLQQVTDVGNVVTYPPESTFVKYKNDGGKFVRVFSDDEGHVFFEVRTDVDNKTIYQNGAFKYLIDGVTYVNAFPSIDGTLAIRTQPIVVAGVGATVQAKFNASFSTTITVEFLDPVETPIEAEGYIVYVLNGTSTIGGVGYTAGSLVYRFYNGSSWISKDYGTTPTATQVNALAIDGSNASVPIVIIDQRLQVEGSALGTMLYIDPTLGQVILGHPDDGITVDRVNHKIYNILNGDVFSIYDWGLGTINFSKPTSINGSEVLTQATGLAIDGSNATGDVNIGSFGLISQFLRSKTLEINTNADDKKAIILATDIFIDTNYEMPEEGGKFITQNSTTNVLPDFFNKRYQTDAQQTNNDATSPIQAQLDSKQGTLNYPHTIFTPTTGSTVNVVNKQYNIINPAGTLLALTINLPGSPANGDSVQIKYTQGISTVTYTGGTVVSPITTPVTGMFVILVYDSGSNKWY